MIKLMFVNIFKENDNEVFRALFNNLRVTPMTDIFLSPLARST